jgi:hypothetical protein
MVLDNDHETSNYMTAVTEWRFHKQVCFGPLRNNQTATEEVKAKLSFCLTN